jgi:hypothetical protein
MASIGETIYAGAGVGSVSTRKVDYAEINDRLLPMLPSLIAEWLPAGRKEGREYVCGDLQGNSGKSLSINLATGRWCDFATDDKGGDIVSLYAALKGLRQSEAATELSERHGLGFLPANRPKSRIDKIKVSFLHPKYGKPSQVWAYNDADGEVLHYVARYDTESGKQIVPFLPNGAMKHVDAPRPLYGLDELAARPSAPVIICEGEKAADAAQRLKPDAVAVTWSGGSNAAAKADWMPLQGRTVTLWPDADNAGAKAATATKAALTGIAANIRVIDVNDKPDKWDAADAEAEGLTASDVETLLGRANERPWLTRAKEFSAEPSPIKWLIKYWVQEQALMMVHGPSGSGKTFVVLDWCLHISAGKPEWFGHKAHSGRVIYLAGEGHQGLKGRTAAWRQHHSVDDPDMYLSSSGCDLNTPDGLLKVITEIRGLDCPPAIIIVDTLHRFLDGDENSAKDAKTMLDACAALMEEFGCTVILVHHTGVSEEAQHRARGSSAWKGALDIEVSIVPPKKDGDSIKITQRKMKDAETAEPMFVELQAVEINGWEDEDGEPVTSAVLTEGVRPAKAKVNSTEAKHQKFFEDAWAEGGCELHEDKPYVTKSTLKSYLEGQNFSAATIRNYSKPSYPSGTIGILADAECIEPVADGWVVIASVSNNTWVSIMMLTRGSRGSEEVQ